jgi:hypothetical protein
MKLLLREVSAETADDDPADQQAEYDRILALLS